MINTPKTVSTIPALRDEIEAQIRACTSHDEAMRQVCGLLFGAGMALHTVRGEVVPDGYFMNIDPVSKALIAAHDLESDLLAPWCEDPAPGDHKAAAGLMLQRPRLFMTVVFFAGEAWKNYGGGQAGESAAEAIVTGALLARGHARSQQTWETVGLVTRTAVAQEKNKKPYPPHSR